MSPVWSHGWRNALLLAALVAPTLGCNEVEASCPRVVGVFQPQYAMLSGTCGPLTTANSVKVDDNISYEHFLNADVETETIVMGCSVRMTQIVRDKTGAAQLRIEANSLDVENENMLTGEMQLTRYDAMGQATCSGLYDATLMKPTSTLGGATQGALP